MVNLIILGSGSLTERIIDKAMVNHMFNLVGVIPDYSISQQSLDEYTDFLKKRKIVCLSLDKESLTKCDIAFSIGYSRIIPADIAEHFWIVNLHGGILPKYRGFSCNPWAIVNGEQYIGFSLHRVNTEIDDGELYYVDRIDISSEQTYSDVYHIMEENIIDNSLQIIADIVHKKIKGKPQEGSVVYCNKYNSKMGNLGSFDRTSDYYINLYRSMAKPHGSGVYLFYKGVRYEVDKIEHGKKYGVENYIGISGKIVNIANEKIWVKTSDNVVVLTLSNSDNVSLFRIGNALGE